MSRMNIISVAYTPMNPMLEDELKEAIEELDYCSYEQHGDEFHLTDLGGGILPALVENGLLTQEEASEIINQGISHLVFEG